MTTASPNTARRFSPSAAMGGRRVLLPYLGSLAIVSLLTLAAVFFFGRVQGTEFAPSHFELREFSYWEVPILKIQISPIHRNPIALPLANQLTTGNSPLLPRGQQAQAEWHLVEVTRGGSSDPGDAQLLVDFLYGSHYLPQHAGWFHQPTATHNGWSHWTTAHPQLAAQLWPRVQALAQRQQYLLIPDLFRLAHEAGPTDSAESAATFAATIDRFLGERYRAMIDDFQAAGQTDLADWLQQEAQLKFPGDQRFSAAVP